MPVYIWKGKNRKNRTIKGEMEGSSADAVRSRLLKQRITPKSVKPKPKDLFENIEFLQPKVETKDVIVFCRQFSTMIDAGVPVVQCLDILSSQEENPTFKKVLKSIKESVESGDTLANAMKKHPKVFNSLFINMVAAGEAGGILDEILRRVSAYMEKAAKLKAQVKGAMTYPLVTIIIAFVVVAVILVFVIPVFEKMFAEMGQSLPAPTQFVINASDFVQGNIWYILGGIAAFIFIFKRVYKTKRGNYFIDDILLKLPVIGILIKKVAVANFTRTMGTMLASGVSILDALDIVAKTSGNAIVEESVLDVKDAISEGRTMAEPLVESGVFPTMVCSMISVGEQTGALESMLAKIADFYEEEVDQAVENLTSLIEPFMISFLGIVVGGLVVSMYLPVFQMAGGIA
ncbi:MAG: type II secretion system F family protein [Desulforegulaceae bacterium]|nr:type II secretion system F family protein [Desulforegulaceae bacterium]